MTLREQIEAALADIDAITRNRVLDIIDQHECYDRDALARALHRLDGLGMSGLPIDPDQCWHEADADAILAALKENP